MDTNAKIFMLDTKAKLSTLWIFLLLNVLFRDIHEFFREGLLAEMVTGTVNGVVVTEETLLIAGIVLEIMIVMVVLSRILEYRINRWANIIIGVIAIPLILTSIPRDLDDIFFTSVEILTLLFIIWSAWRWSESGLTQAVISNSQK